MPRSSVENVATTAHDARLCRTARASELASEQSVVQWEVGQKAEAESIYRGQYRRLCLTREQTVLVLC